MGKIENDKERMQRNEHFMTAFKYVAKMLKMNQGELATAIGSKSAYISNFSKGLRPVPSETVEALIRISCSEGCQKIYSEYLTGNSDIMLLANVSAEQLAEDELRKSNPDYDTMKSREQQKWQQVEQSMQHPYIDPSSEHNATISAYIQLTNRLTDDLKQKEQEMADRLAEKDDHIATLVQRIADKEEIIRARDARILDLERQLAAASNTDLQHYPFTIGTAEHHEQPNI